MTGDQQRLLEERDRLDELHRSYDGDAKLNESFVVLTLGASLIATLGLLADNAAVVIEPWWHPDPPARSRLRHRRRLAIASPFALTWRQCC